MGIHLDRRTRAALLLAIPVAGAVLATASLAVVPTPDLSLCRSFGTSSGQIRASAIGVRGAPFVVDFAWDSASRSLVPRRSPFSPTRSAPPAIANLAVASALPGCGCAPQFPDNVTLRFDFADLNGDAGGGAVMGNFLARFCGGGSCASFFNVDLFPPNPCVAVEPSHDAAAGTVTVTFCFGGTRDADFQVWIVDAAGNASAPLSLAGVPIRSCARIGSDPEESVGFCNGQHSR